mmetsp:Transcript_8046/g.16710  ORF Transcript_8046/g.16710 Transcript_8046/m.16710 type:complete len:334 (-) Transcript_8046:249-1250(-)
MVMSARLDGCRFEAITFLCAWQHAKRICSYRQLYTIASSLARSQTIPELDSRGPRVLGFDQEVQCRQNEKAQKDVHEDLVGEPKAKKLEVLDLDIEDLVDRRVAGVVRKGLGGKLNHRQGAQQHQTDVEQEGAHVGLSENHRVELDAGDSEAKLETSGHGRKEQVNRKEGHTQNSKEGKPLVKPGKVAVQKERPGVLRKDVDDNVDDPHNGNHNGADSQKERYVRLERVVAVVARCAGLEIVHVLFQQKDTLLELQQRLSLHTCLLAFCRVHIVSDASDFAHARVVLALDLDELANVHQLVDPISQVLLGLGILDRIHVLGAVLKDQQQIQWH